MSDATMPLDEFRKRFEEDDNEWWRLQPGDMLNLFDAAVDRIEAVEEIVKEMKESVEEYSQTWFYLVKLQRVLAGEYE